ncbi:MAG: hypothetical protein J6W36_04490 [Clostridiales bacterium]|nr:hypothetical protein [Clostridiales bacterium]
MVEKILEYKGGIEMAVVCSDLSLLENINALLKENGVIGIKSDDGVIHYIIDGRQSRSEASAAVSALVRRNSGGGVDVDFFDACVKSVFREFGFDMSLIGTSVLTDAVKNIYLSGARLPVNLKTIYVSVANSYKMTFSQIERDVRYAIKNSTLSEMRTRIVLQTLITRVGKRIRYGLEGP